MPPVTQPGGGKADLERPPWLSSADTVLDALDTHADKGLAADEADSRLQRYGLNMIRGKSKTPWYEVLLNQFRSVIVLVMVGAAILSSAFGMWAETIALAVVI
ncbi:hypothetical protein GF324_00510, partial [bacterium]|nr:hypothetical protein [bacterium]